MRTLQDFFKSIGMQGYGPAHENRFSRSCACAYTSHLAQTFQGGLQFAVFPSDFKVSKPSLSHIVHKKFKLKSGYYLHFDFMCTGKKPLYNQRYRVRERSLEGNTTNEFISFSICYLTYLLAALNNGYNLYDPESRKYERQPPATAEELKAIKAEFRSIVKGKLVGILYENIKNEYCDTEKKIEEIKNKLGLFKKKPRFSININNTVHPKDNDYLTFQLYQY